MQDSIFLSVTITALSEMERLTRRSSHPNVGIARWRRTCMQRISRLRNTLAFLA
jgi:hypothetical protein